MSSTTTTETTSTSTTETPQRIVVPPQPKPSQRWDLFRLIPGLKRLVKMRSFQFLVILPNLLVFELFLLAGLFGSPVGNRNIIIIYVWIFWWFLLIAFIVPFGSRVWCTVCPLPFFGEWLQRLALVKVRPGKTKGTKNKLYGLNKRWPKRLSNIWLQNFGFMCMATFSAILVTRPFVTAVVLGGMALVATALAWFYRMRSFCNYLCPVSGFLSLYAMTATVELRSLDKNACLKCKSKACVTGSDKGWACPWFIYMGKLDRNNYCGMCMECVKSCPNDNIGLMARPFASDIRLKGFDEAWKAFIMLTLALVYSLTLLAPWGTVKDWANVSEVRNWAGFGVYALGMWLSAMVLLPAVFALAVRTSQRLAQEPVSFKELFLGYAYVLVPMGLAAWIAFSIPLIMVNGSYIVSVTSDPMGWGWNLFGTADYPWTPYWPDKVGYVQIVVLLIGLYYSLVRGYEAAGKLFSSRAARLRSLVPIAALLVAITLGFFRLYLG